jgi:hypothetical protein
VRGVVLLVVVLAQFNPQLVQFVQHSLKGAYVVSFFPQQFQYILECDIALLIGSVHQFLDHGRSLPPYGLVFGRSRHV